MTGIVHRLRPCARRQRWALIGGGILACLDVLVTLAQPWPLSLLVGHVLTPGHRLPVSDTTAVGIAIAATLLIAVIGGLVDYWSSKLLSSAGLRIAADIRADVFAHLQRMSLRFHSQHQVGDLTARVTGDVDRMQDLLVQALSVLLPNTLLVGGMATVMILLDPGFALVALAATPLMALVVFRSTRQLKTAARRARRADGQVAAATTEGLGAMPLVQAFSLEPRMSDRIQGLINESMTSGLEAVRLQSRFSPIVDLASAVSTALVLGFGAVRVLHGSLDLAVLLVFLGYVSSLYKPLKALAKLSTVFSKGMAASERVLDILDRAPDIRDEPQAVTAPSFSGRIEFAGVTFSYGREPVLDGLDLTIDAGETLALVGATGAGKSTVAALVCRLMDPQCGSVRVDGMDLRSLTVASVRAQVSLVLQDCLLLEGTLRDNIAWARPSATAGQIEDAARRAQVYEFADRLPDGLDTMVGERGAALSGGQRQRTALARAIIRDSPILILDEPTSALDALSERLIVRAVNELPPGRTTIVIAHRLSTIRTADRIAVLQRGKVIELGTPEALLRSGGAYARLVAAQQTGRDVDLLDDDVIAQVVA